MNQQLKKMTTEEFIHAEHGRLLSFRRLIERSLSLNAQIEVAKREEILEVVNRAFKTEIEYLHEEPEEYRRLYCLTEIPRE